jgi:hypothetical protein
MAKSIDQPEAPGCLVGVGYARKRLHHANAHSFHSRQVYILDHFTWRMLASEEHLYSGESFIRVPGCTNT